MSTFTENYNLIKPSSEDYYDIQDWNENMDTIDSQMMASEQAIEGVGGKIGNPSDTETETIFAKLNSIGSALQGGISLIKSIQRVVYSPARDTTTGSVSINPIDTSRSIVIMEHLQDNASNSGLTRLEYTLNTSSISFSHESKTPLNRIYGFWIIEFN